MDTKKKMVVRFCYLALLLAATSCGSGSTSDGSTTPSGNNTPTCPPSDAGAGSLLNQLLLGTWFGLDDATGDDTYTTFKMDGTYSYHRATDAGVGGTGTYSVSGASEPPSAAAPWTLQMSGVGPTQNAETRVHRIIAIDSMALTMLSTHFASGIVTWSRK